MKKFIFFRFDRLGDFIIITNLIKHIKNRYPNSKITVFCSRFNYNFIKKHNKVDKAILYDRKFSFTKKILIFRNILKEKYFASFAIDGKSTSNFINLFLKSKFKLGLSYKFFFLGLFFSKPNFFYNKFIFNKYETFTSKSHLKKIEHLPTKLNNLAKFLGFNIKITESYYFLHTYKSEKTFHNLFKKYIKKNYILVHLDEKWLDIIDIRYNLYNFLNNLQNYTKKNILVTSYKNNFPYYLNFKKEFKIKRNKKIILLENLDLFVLERFIKHSFCSISCHSGYIVQIGASNSTKLIDIINKNDYNWYSCWKPKNTKHFFVFKSIKNKIYLKNILTKIISITKNF